MRSLAALILATLIAAPVAADRPRAKTPAATKPATAKPGAATATDHKACKRVVTGRGLERKVVCELTSDVVVTSRAPKPQVQVAPRDGRAVVGRPRSEDRLNGLSRRLRK
ncbi:MAG: hypothetical protein AB7O24_01365 [Kofleriaceae bacterium]